jgi:hypothetical protein
VLTADELSISYLAADKLLLPILSFSEVKTKGVNETLGKLLKKTVSLECTLNNQQ